MTSGSDKVSQLEALYIQLDMLKVLRPGGTKAAAAADEIRALSKQIETLEGDLAAAGAPVPTDVKWSGSSAVPLIGAEINVRMKSLGRAKVIAYYPTEGYLGLRVRFLSPPEWWIKQETGRHGTGLVFGVEIE